MKVLVRKIQNLGDGGLHPGSNGDGDKMVNSHCCSRYDRQEVLLKRSQAANASSYEEESVEVCKEKSITIKVNVQEKILDSRLKLDLNSQNTMLKKKKHLTINILVIILT